MANLSYSFSKGTGLNYFKTGTGMPLVLVHGTGFDNRIWIRAAEYLSSRFIVYTIDRNGFGKSLHSTTDMSDYLSGQADGLLNFIEEEIGTPAIVVGWSSGALAAFRAAIRDQKGLISRIISVEAPYLSSSDSDLGSILKFMKMIYWQIRGREHKAIEAFLRIVLDKTDGTNSFDNLGNDIIASVTQNAGVSLSEIRTRTGEDIGKEKLRSLTIPVDFITGDLSPAFIRRSNSRLSGIFPAGKWEHIENGGHLALYECPEEFSRKVAGLAGVKI